MDNKRFNEVVTAIRAGGGTVISPPGSLVRFFVGADSALPFESLMARPSMTLLASEAGIVGKSDLKPTRRQMDAKFRAKLLGAIADGLEHCPTSPSSHLGTKNPISGYER